MTSYHEFSLILQLYDYWNVAFVGSYKHKFTSTGTFYYWSGYIDANALVYYRGVIEVKNKEPHDSELSVTNTNWNATSYVKHSKNSISFNIKGAGYTDKCAWFGQLLLL